MTIIENPDWDKYCLGKLCKRGHDWNGTGKSLRRQLDRICHQCKAIYDKKYYNSKPGKDAARNRDYFEANREKIKARYRVRYWKNREKELERNRKKYQISKNRQKAWQSQYRKQNPEINRIQGHRRRARKKQVHHYNYTTEELKLLYEKFDNACAYCGSTEKLTIDHAVALSKGGSDVLGNLLPACMTCNCSKFNRDIEQWYKSQSYYSKARWKKITLHLGWKNCNGQLSLF